VTANGVPLRRTETCTRRSERIRCFTLSADEVAIPSGGDGVSGAIGEGSATLGAAAAGAARTSPAAPAASANLRLGGW